jgi:hypothetical protein
LHQITAFHSSRFDLDQIDFTRTTLKSASGQMPARRRLAGGCHLNLPIDRLIEGSGLRLAELETGYLVKGPRVATYHYRGRALA